MIRHPLFQRRLDELSLASDLVWLAAMSVGLGFTLLAAYLYPSSFWAYAGLLIRASLYLWSGEALADRGGRVLRTLFWMGIVAGSFELIVDYGLVHGVRNGRLVYFGNDVVLLASPIWMPLAWACVIVEIGYPTLRLFGALRKRMTTPTAAIMASLVGAVGAGVTVGFYEYFAYRAQWWRYEPAHAMIGKFCALYIPLGEFLMFLPVVPIAARALSDPDRPVSASIAAGARFAVAIGVGYALAYLLLEAGRLPISGTV